MAITTRETTATGVTNKGSPLTNAELDTNFVELQQDKLENIVEDTTPQLGGSLDVNGNAIVSLSNANIALTPNGTGVVRLDGNVDIQSGEIALKNAGSVSNIKLYCEVSNAHYTQLQSSAHGAYSGNVTLTLPAATDTLVGKATTDTFTNKSGNISQWTNDSNYLTSESDTLATVTGRGATTSTSITIGGLHVNATTAVEMPAGTDAQRPTAVTGMLRFNTTSTTFEGYDGSAWGAIGGGGGATEGVFYENDQTLSTNVTIAATKNAMATGPVAISSGVSVTVSNGARVVIL